MRRGHLGLLGALSFVATAVGAGCSNDPGTGGAGSGGQSAGSAGQSAGSAGQVAGSAGKSAGGSGGVMSTGGAAGTGGALDCTNVSACGGDVVGTWNVASSCLELSGDMDVSQGSLGCATVPVIGSLQTTGTFVANANGTFTDNTTTTGSVAFPLHPSCLSISSVPVPCDRIASIFLALGWTSGTCAEAGGLCSCALTVEQQGGMGQVLSFTEQAGTYTTSGTTLSAANANYAYCTAGDTLTVTPQMSSLTGTVVLQKDGGSGGMGGAGGMSGAAGMSGTGGASGMSGQGGTSGAAGAGGDGGSSGAMGGSSGTAGSGGMGTGPCDIYAAANNTCVAAHSTVRALFSSYNGPLYQVLRASDSTTLDIPVLTTGGVADSAQQETFCTGTTCTIMRVYDQSGNGNFLEAQIPSSTVGGRQGQTAANAAADSLNVGGHKVYSLYTRPSQAYWRDGSSSGMPLGAEPQGVYMVTSGEHFNGGCCYNYGNSQTSRTYEGGPTMDSVYFGNCTIWGSGAGDGPWVMADMEDGIVSGNTTGMNPNSPSWEVPYVTALEKNNGTTEFAIKGGDATTGNLTTIYKGALPAGKNPMRKEGAIVLGSGGDCCYSNNNASEGTFYEGAIVTGYPSDATDEAVQANIVSAGYGE